MAGETPALHKLRAGRPRSVFCPSEKARQRASHRDVGPRVPGMNAGPKTARGGKRPLTGVFAQPFAGNRGKRLPWEEARIGGYRVGHST